jgi:hypothetical protein
MQLRRRHCDEAVVMQKRDRLSIRIPWLIEAVAEGPLAIIALLALALVLVIINGQG